MSEVIENIAKREFGEDGEVMVGFKRGKLLMAGTFKKRDREKHFDKVREVIQ